MKVIYKDLFTYTWHFRTVEDYGRINFICTAKFQTFLDGGGICKDLFYMSWKIPDIFGWWRNILGSTLFVLQNSWHFRRLRTLYFQNFRIWREMTRFFDVNKILPESWSEFCWQTLVSNHLNFRFILKITGKDQPIFRSES